MISTNKVFIDSRCMTRQSNSSTDFYFSMNETLYHGENTVCSISDVCFPNVIYTIESFNENLYFSYIVGNNKTDYIIRLTHKNYDISALKDELVSKINGAIGANNIIGSYSESSGFILLSINTNDSFYIYNIDDIKYGLSNWTGSYYNKSNPKSCNNILNNNKISSGPYNKYTSYKTGFINTTNLDAVYIRCSQLGYNNYGPNGERDIIKKICLDQPFGKMVTQFGYVDDYEYTDVSKSTLQTLRFIVTDVYSNVIDLRGNEISFSLVFRHLDSNFN